jgi:hypothetical protein
MKKLFFPFLLLLPSIGVYGSDPLPHPYGLAAGKAELKSVGSLAIGPDGILFVADPKAAAVFALDLKETKTDTTTTPLEIKNIDKALAAFLGIEAQDVVINDMIVHPASQNIYLSVTRGRSVDALPVLIKISKNAEISQVKTDNVLFSRADISNAPGADDKTPWGQPKRQLVITDLSYLDGTLYVAGLSNEEFASRLRRMSFPFKPGENASTTSVEIFHTSHNRYETHAPIETLLLLKLNNEPYILAGYGCAPLAKFSVAELKEKKHVKGATLAELGGGSRPLDMIIFQRKGEDHVLIANSNRSVYKLKVSDLERSQPITTPVDDIFVSSGTPYVATGYVGVIHIDNLNRNFVAAIQRDIQTGALNLSSIAKRWL